MRPICAPDVIVSLNEYFAFDVLCIENRHHHLRRDIPLIYAISLSILARGVYQTDPQYI